MDADVEQADDVATEAAEAASAERERSTIQFPYMDLKDVMMMVRAIHQNVGQGEATEDQLAAWMNLSPKSSGFRVRTGTAKMFGMIDSNSDGLRLTPLGRAAMDPAQEGKAKVEAFLTVPLYKLAYENYKGGVVPPAAAFERDIRSWGVAAKQTSRARQAMERSAEEAGFYESGRNRLVIPASASFKGGSEPEVKAGGNGGGGSGGGEPPPTIDPIIKGLIDRLPKPGSEWEKSKRKLWLQILENSFDLVYEDELGERPKDAFS
ncbi:hypothetical protein [Aliihoeflea sp. 2WW]|uniref:hypothetical protein n=1 Tax=Aliihoeflea sp. 2WW TaxID=1381123 RepID=UPI0004662FE3|nr:hypothetical protein [Aliihoeflea sp. 2WW]